MIPLRQAGFDMFLLAAAILGSLLLTDPRGDFPLNDDWSFALAVKWVIESGEFRPTGWGAMTLLTHVVWGALFAHAFGLSFETLRAATLVSFIAGSLGAYWLVRELGGERWLARLIASVATFSPVAFGLSHTFMTDVPFATLITLASICLVRVARDDSHLALGLGTLLLVAATLSRQLGVLFPAAFVPALLLQGGITRKRLIRAAIPLAASISALLVFDVWLSASGHPMEMYSHRNATAFASVSRPGAHLAVARNGYLLLLYMGLFLLPVLIPAAVALLRSRGGRARSCLLIACAVVLCGLAGLADDHLMPDPLQVRTNVLQEWGVGPLLLHDTFILGRNRPPGMFAWFPLVLTAMSLAGAALLLTALLIVLGELVSAARAGRLPWSRASGCGLIFGSLAYLSPLVFTGFFDRYLVPALVPFAAGLVSLVGSTSIRTTAGSRAPKTLALGLTVAYAAFAVCGTRDYLAWNRERWRALDDLLASGQATIGEIDGGFEFNGWHSYDPSYRIDPSLSPWWVERDTFRIGLGGMPGYATVREYPVSLWMPPHTGKVLVLRRIPMGVEP